MLRPVLDPLAFSTLAWSGIVIIAGMIPSPPQVLEHPLMPVIRVAEKRLEQFDLQVRDYTCVLAKRERIDGSLSEYEYLSLMVRQERRRDGQIVVPFSVYVRYLQPSQLAGREAIYVEGQNKGKVIVRRGGERFPHMTTSLHPRSDLALRGSHYPITDAGLRSLIVRMLERAREDLKDKECGVIMKPGAKIDGRPCTFIQVKHPVRRDSFRYHIAQVFIDDELQLPVRYASYSWPEQEGGPPTLIEEYTFRDVRFNVSLADADFDYRNRQYGFRKDYEP